MILLPCILLPNAYVHKEIATLRWSG